MNRLLIDVGASSIKSVIQENNVLDIKTEYVSESFSTKHGDKFNPEIIIKEFISHVERQYESLSFKEIWICSEMHNFTLFDTKSMEYSDFYSWRYTSSESDLIRSKVLDHNRKHHEISGQTLFQGIPFINIFESCNENSSQKVLSLPELIVHMFGKSFDAIHDSMAASLGCLDIKNKTWLTNDLKYIYPNVNLILPKVFGNDEVPLIGEIKIKSNKINVFGGFGDLQTALLGAQISKEDVCINIGTGSQILAMCDSNLEYSENYDVKPFFGKFIKAISHIPAGRSFNFIKNKICKDKNFWQNLNDAQKTLPEDYIPEFSLNIFKSNWRYDDENHKNILESFRENHLFYEILLKSFCNEYLIAFKKIDPNNKYKNLVLSGGKLKDIKYVKDFFSDIKDYSIKAKKHKLMLDETLIGLNMLTKIYN